MFEEISRNEENSEKKSDTAQAGQRMTDQAPRHSNAMTGMKPIHPVQLRRQPLIRQNASKRIVQMAGHIHVFEAQSSEKGIDPVNNDAAGKEGFLNKPLIVFETFGGDEKQLLNIYKQTLQYDGNTICILGINEQNIYEETNPLDKKKKKLIGKLKDAENGIEEEETQEEVIQPLAVQSLSNNAKKKAAKLEARSLKKEKKTERRKLDIKPVIEIEPKVREEKWVHRWHVIPFIWSKPKGVKSSYEVPYLEVREMLMEAGEILSKDVKNVVFRWIDRDVTNDNSVRPENVVVERDLRELAKGKDPVFMTGIYNWKYSNERLKSFGADSGIIVDMVKKLNDTEKVLRMCFYEIRDYYGIDPAACYLPEPVLFFNRFSHKIAMANLHEKIESIGEIGQDGESKAAVFKKYKGDPQDFKVEGVPAGAIRFTEAAQVDKPVKLVKEGSYLHQMEDYMMSVNKMKPAKHQKKSDAEQAELEQRAAFIVALSNSRQSAFNNSFWSFINESPFDKWNGDMEGEMGILGHELNYDNPKGTDEFINKFCDLAHNPIGNRADITKLLEMTGSKRNEIKRILAQIELNLRRCELADKLYLALR